MLLLLLLLAALEEEEEEELDDDDDGEGGGGGGCGGRDSTRWAAATRFMAGCSTHPVTNDLPRVTKASLWL
jgi:hypothetical protein